MNILQLCHCLEFYDNLVFDHNIRSPGSSLDTAVKHRLPMLSHKRQTRPLRSMAKQHW